VSPFFTSARTASEINPIKAGKPLTDSENRLNSEP
jgi:hypothetical protein